MSQLYTGLVNETVVEAVRVALDAYAAEHHITPEASARPGVITAAEEDVIRRAVLTGLQGLRSVQTKLTDVTREAASGGGVVTSENLQALHAARVDSAASLKDAMAELMADAPALQDVVQQVSQRIREHLQDSRVPDTRDASAVAAVYTAAPDVTRVLAAAVERQVTLRAEAAQTRAAQPSATAASTVVAYSAEHWVWLVATLVVGYVAVRVVFGRLLRFGGLMHRHHRSRTVLIGLPESGKTALFAQLVRRMQLRETRTSMQVSVGPLLAAAEHGLSATADGITIVDCPGHPRLREGMLRAVADAVNVIVVIDAVTVQDSQHEGVAALAELLLGVLQSPEFFGVRRLLFVCTKRDEVTSYAAKAVRKLLEAAMVASIESRQNGMGRVESVRDSNNVVVASRGRKRTAGGRRYVLSLEGDDSMAGGGEMRSANRRDVHGAGGGGAHRFSFEQLGIPFAFVDVSSRPHPTEHRYSVAPVEEFVVGK